MKRLSEIYKKEFIISVVFCFIFYIFFPPLACFCYEPVQTVVITKEDIKNACPVSPYQVKFNSKDLKSIKMLEKRHFNKTYDDMKDCDRLSQLEYELLDRTWRFIPQKERIKKLEIVSSNVMLEGMALPVNLSHNRTIKRLRNNQIPRKEKDNVGLIDGFLRLVSPEKYEIYKQSSKHFFEEYEY